jgi:anti-sigma regulatory factor (Ser/Thr protein kinase)
MISTTPIMLKVAELSQVSATRRAAADIARELGFSEERAGAVAIVATEIATNLIKHGRDGRVQLLSVGIDKMFLELLGIDSGPGISDTTASLADGFSTAGTTGTGLGAIRRLASEFDLYSQPGKGTVVLGRLADGKSEQREQAVRVGVVQVPARWERVSGDAWVVVQDARSATVMVADGLGHGPLAAEAAQEAVRVVRSSAGLDPDDILRHIHSALRPTRGAAVAVAHIDLPRSRVRYTGIGNISGLISGPGSVQRLVSHNGTAGAEARRIQGFDYTWPANGLLVMHSDGMSSNWDWSGYPGLQEHDAAVIAGVLYRDHNRGRDDATVVVVKAAV